jgi:hypothetical protein
MPPATVADLATAALAELPMTHWLGGARVESELLQVVVIPSEGEVPRKRA